MEMKKVACAVLFAAASMSAVMAEVAAPAPAPTSDASASLPVVGSVVGASVVSLLAYFLH
ncbi:arabinogalactan peptide 23-like [Herrania umbratica]|uniref:Arabinogalactan peptide 23-like n=2 Tax=Byttnerioideae TaxID=214909 RepID=A0AB32WKS2_THECC|nr:PREDICTED: arabinogalactan peptide 23-like [Theobroma cacao]XP_021280570.1 arabinogalactan peptide 23-like [Herrania umbratica]